MKLLFTLFTTVALAVSTSRADFIELQSGVRVEGKVMKATDERVFLRVDQSTFVYPRSFVSAIEVSKPKSSAIVERRRLPDVESFLDSFVSQKWVNDIRDVPATVIDTGVLKYVPYMSYRCGDYEINIYGDPAKPAGIEIGVLKKLVDNEEAKRNCLAFIASVLSKEEDRHVVKALKLAEDRSILSGMTFEITPPTAEDAYGGWWVSVYDESALDKSRASDEEIKLITVNKDEIRKKQKVASVPSTKPVPAKPADDPSKVVMPIVPVSSEPVWNDDDLRYARPAKQSTVSSGGSVYVRGYTRKDGTYVRPHTRRK